MTETGDRRPLASRNTRWAQAIARRLAAMSITPNQISQASMAAAALAGVAFWMTSETQDGLRALLFLGSSRTGPPRAQKKHNTNPAHALESGGVWPDSLYFTTTAADLMTSSDRVTHCLAAAPGFT